MEYSIISDSLVCVIHNNKRYDILKTEYGTVTCSCMDYRGRGSCQHLDFLKDNGFAFKVRRLGKDPYSWMQKYEEQIERKTEERWSR
jgi:hypothetical protein